jgi:hypothetical protein
MLKNTSGNTLGKLFNILYLKDNIIESMAVLKTNIDLEEPAYLTAEDGQISVSVTPLF